MSQEKFSEQFATEQECCENKKEVLNGEELADLSSDDNPDSENQDGSTNADGAKEEQVADTQNGKLEQEVIEYRDKLMRKIAEFENYKKRTAEEYTRLINTATEGFIVKLLPVVDDFERLQKNIKSTTSVEDLSKGVELILNKFNSLLTASGLKEIPAVNEEFNHDLHEALMQMENPNFAPNKIIDQHEKGYTLNGKVVRHSKVLVAK